MKILAIETTGPFCSVALIDEKGNISVKESGEKLNHLKTLMPMAEELLKENSINMKEISAIAVSIGPGSFTGIRIGVTTARSLAQILGIRCIPVPTLKAFAIGLRDKGKAGGDKAVCPVFDARRKQIYACCLIGDEEVVSSGAYDPDEFLDKVKNAMNEKNISESIFAGDGTVPYEDLIKETMEKDGFTTDIKRETYQEAGAVAKLALEMYEKNETVNYEKLKPEYMRKPEAQRRLEERLKGF